MIQKAVWFLLCSILITGCVPFSNPVENNLKDSQEKSVSSAQTGIRTVIYIYKETRPGQRIFIRGGHDEHLVPSVYPSMSENILSYCNTLNSENLSRKTGDTGLDWFSNSSLDWTGSYWPAEWGARKQYSVDGFGEDPENSFGLHYWKFDVVMEGQAGDWFEFKAFMTQEGVPQPFWENNISQPDTPYKTINHWARKGYINVVRFGENGITMTPLENDGLEKTLLAKNIQPSPLPDGWWKRSVFYELYVRSFKDSNGDGHGDLQGVIEKLPYLKSLGIGGIWLLPVLEDPDNDHGYNVSDFRKIEDSYGTADDFQELLDAAHDLGIGVVIDMIPNHISPDHPYFVTASQNRQSAARNFFIWSDTRPSGTWDLETTLFPWRETLTGWVYSTFSGDFPDLNYRNTLVETWMTNNLIYWLNQGVDGFRFDAVTHLVENGRLRSELYDQPETVEIMKRFSSQIRSYNNKFTVGEQSARESYLGNGSDLLHSTFAWGFAHAVIDAVNTGTACPSAYGSLDQVLRNTVLENIPSAVRRSTLLSNHDTIVGDRPMTRFNGDDAKAGLAATCYLLSPGVPFIYYGEEIGMKKYTESAVPDNDYALRTPMQWEDGTHAGFTTAAQPWRKINSNYTVYNVSDESSDPGSILNHYRKLTSIRNQSPALGDGGYRLLTINSQIWAFERSLGNEKVMVVINLSANPSSVSLNLTGVAPSGTVRSPGADLYDPSVIHPSLTDSNRTSYPVSVPARGVRIIRFQN